MKYACLVLSLLVTGLAHSNQTSSTRHQFLVSRGVPADAAADALKYYDTNKQHFENQDWISIIDYRKHSTEKRFFIYSVKQNKLYALLVAHGKGSDKNHDGYAERFSNTPSSKMSSIGFYKVSETYHGSNGLSIRLDGLSETNSKARARAVVIHGANYVKKNTRLIGRSWGCPAVESKLIKPLAKRIKGGSLMLAYY